MSSATCTVYGRNLQEILNAARMIMRPLFGDYEPDLELHLEAMPQMPGLWKAEALACWSTEDQ